MSNMVTTMEVIEMRPKRLLDKPLPIIMVVLCSQSYMLLSIIYLRGNKDSQKKG